METVSVQIPAALYTEIYMRHKEQTGDVINECLQRLIGEGQPEPQVEKAEAPRYSRPGKGTKTGKVWEIADRIYQSTGNADRVAVVTACVEEMININTANTQFTHWKAATVPSEE